MMKTQVANLGRNLSDFSKKLTYKTQRITQQTLPLPLSPYLVGGKSYGKGKSSGSPGRDLGSVRTSVVGARNTGNSPCQK